MFSELMWIILTVLGGTSAGAASNNVLHLLRLRDGRLERGFIMLREIEKTEEEWTESQIIIELYSKLMKEVVVVNRVMIISLHDGPGENNY